jgi:hypothetical protein
MEIYFWGPVTCTEVLADDGATSLVLFPTARLHNRRHLVLKAERLERAERDVLLAPDDAAGPPALAPRATGAAVVVFLPAVAQQETSSNMYEAPTPFLCPLSSTRDLICCIM